MDLDVFARLVEQKRPAWEQQAITVEFQVGPKRDKSAAWVSCEGPTALAQLIVWTSGEADLTTGRRDRAQQPATQHYEVTSEVGLLGCLDDLTAFLLNGG